MGKQHRKVVKRRRRTAYLDRKKEIVRLSATTPLRPVAAVVKSSEPKNAEVISKPKKSAEKKEAAPKAVEVDTQEITKTKAPKATAEKTSEKKAPAKKPAAKKKVEEVPAETVETPAESADA